MRDSVRTTDAKKPTVRAEIVRAHEIAHDATKNRQIAKQNQRRAPARLFLKNHMDGGGIHALLQGRACVSDSYSTHDRTTRITGQAA